MTGSQVVWSLAVATVVFCLWPTLYLLFWRLPWAQWRLKRAELNLRIAKIANHEARVGLLEQKSKLAEFRAKKMEQIIIANFGDDKMLDDLREMYGDDQRIVEAMKKREAGK